jgi:hypothetical protein
VKHQTIGTRALSAAQRWAGEYAAAQKLSSVIEARLIRAFMEGAGWYQQHEMKPTARAKNKRKR